MTAAVADNTPPDTLPPKVPSDRAFWLAGAIAFAISLLSWSLETDGVWDLVRPLGRDHAWLHILWRSMSDLARGPSLLLCLGFAFLLLGSPARRQLILSSALIGGLLSTLLKWLAHRPRPIIEEGDYSWPSGHTTSAICFALAATIASRRPRRFRVAVWAVCATIALSRVFLLRHWPSDVIAGCGVALVTIPLARRLPLLVEGGAIAPRSLMLCGVVTLVVVLFAAALDPKGLPIPRGWAILVCALAALHGMRGVADVRARTDMA